VASPVMVAAIVPLLARPTAVMLTAGSRLSTCLQPGQLRRRRGSN
jgi:hypothetical protein